MLVKAQRVSKKMDNETLCRPSEGYEDTIEVELQDYVEGRTGQGDLPENDQAWPKGAPMKNFVKVGDKILEKKVT